MTRMTQMMDKMILARNTKIRAISGGYGRLLEESELKGHVYIRKNTIMTVISFNLYTQTVLAVNSATSETYSLEYDYLLENCEIISAPKNSVIEAISIVNVCPVKEYENVYKQAVIFASAALIYLSTLIICFH